MTETRTIRFNGNDVDVTFCFDHWIPKVLRVGAITIGDKVYFHHPPTKVSFRLVAHELVHVMDFYKHKEKVNGRHTAGVFGYLFDYVVKWIKAGFSYKNHPEEIEARAEEDSVLRGHHPVIYAEWLTTNFSRGKLLLA